MLVPGREVVTLLSLKDFLAFVTELVVFLLGTNWAQDNQQMVLAGPGCFVSLSWPKIDLHWECYWQGRNKAQTTGVLPLLIETCQIVRSNKQGKSPEVDKFVTGCHPPPYKLNKVHEITRCVSVFLTELEWFQNLELVIRSVPRTKLAMIESSFLMVRTREQDEDW